MHAPAPRPDRSHPRRLGHGLLFVAAVTTFLGCGTGSAGPAPVTSAPASLPATSAPAASPAAGDASGVPSGSLAAPSPRRSGRTIGVGGHGLTPLATASRIVIEPLGIDLPVVSSDLAPPPNYPLCDVAAYLTTFVQPSQRGTTYITAHAQQGMFLPLLEASLRDDGASLVGTAVHVYTDDGTRYRYEIFRVQRHATDFSLAYDVAPDERRLVLQTSEGPHGTVPKLAIAARLAGEDEVPIEEATPEPRPRDCRPPELGGSEEPTEALPETVDIALPTPTATAVPSASPVPPTPAGTPGGLAPPAVASRVVVRGLRIDLPVVSGDLAPPPNYPLCDVAAYLTTFVQPRNAGTTYLTAHAQQGMFLPLLEASQRRDGRELLGMEVDVYTSDAQRYRYQIYRVQRHATDFGLARDDLQPGEQRLVLQTSEGPHGTVPKLVVAGRLVSVDQADAVEANPLARPRDCRPPELR